MNVTIEQHQKRLEKLSIAELRLEYEKVFGEITTSRHARYIIKRILWQMQANLHGGLSEKALERASKLADLNRLRMTSPRPKPLSEDAQIISRTLPQTITSIQSDIAPGTQLERMYKGQRIVVTIMENGVRFNGELYNSLSAVAREITGTRWNGKLFFGLKKRKAVNEKK